MTKMLTLGAATLCAAVSFADVQSANIVGYANKVAADTTSVEKYGVVCAMFNQIATEGMKLSQITVAGYKDSFFAKAIGVPFVELSTMNNSGKTTATYRWTDEYDGDPEGEGEWTGGYWKNMKTDKIVGTGAGQEDAYMRAGDCYWIHSPDISEYEDLESVNLLFNGEVLTQSYGFIVCDNSSAERYSGIGNMMATPVGLSEMSLDGYKDSFFAKAIGVPFVELSTMNNSGKTVSTFRWIDEYEGDPEGEGVWTGGYWKNMNNEKIIVAKGQVKDADKEEEETTLNPGDGLWAHTPDITEYEDLEKLLLIFPKNF